ncbi:MAG: hypothetical protein ACRC0L_05555, partial [Angustibacter sp.]
MRTMSPPLGSPADRSPEGVLRAAARILASTPQASLASLAKQLGLGRTSLHRMFPTRQGLLIAIAQQALDQVAGIYDECGFGREAPADPLDLASVARLIERLIPLGPSLMFLVRAEELRDNPELEARILDLDR